MGYTGESGRGLCARPGAGDSFGYRWGLGADSLDHGAAVGAVPGRSATVGGELVDWRERI